MESEEEEEQEQEDNEYGAEDNGGTDGNNGATLQGDKPRAAVQVHNNQQTADDAIPSPPLADVLVQNFCLLERLEQEQKDCQLRPYH